MTRPSFVCFAAQDWWYHSQAHSDFQLMKEISVSHRVLVVNSLGMRVPAPGRTPKAWSRMAKKATSMLRYLRAPLDDHPDFYVFTPVSVPVYGEGRAARANARLVAIQVTLACRLLKMRDPVCLVSLPTAQPVLRHLRMRRVVFNRADKLSLFKEADGRRVAELESRLLRGADLVVYASQTLLQSERDSVGDRAYLLGHGVDVELFQRRGAASEPVDLRRIAGPRVGFFGTLDELVDYELLRNLALSLPDAQLVLIGPVLADLGGLTGLPNVHVLGPRPYRQIPSYASGFDVAIMPWVTSEWIHYCNPIKLKEYLALGLPVVSTDFPEVSGFRDVIRVAGDVEGFVAAVEGVLNSQEEQSPEARALRRARIADQSWESQAGRLLNVVGQLL